ncbi:MAG: sigma-54 dependent transcriptional regulator [Pseudomonadota bacterium]|uniref:Sigma-54 interacting transcriptional regulator n=1 Tax=Gallaecimonas pentaromativorans TaxID=584787 RepID=A0A3N1PQR0_9GAMM|nr:sigma-54 dependent transcriptional regulator [Gallaecimonas pentaromativorans]MED5523356.1 sigma-54 dependent transcriptional regulator [Pseudomonadota bacterium]ROQ30549.1 sigma-54 interacting transcriptional regulator [Gallaecimonas pentaromativorans]
MSPQQSHLVGSSELFQQVLKRLHQLAGIDATVLVTGESGTGKELAARALHYLGQFSEKPFIPVNCGALSDSLLESELFGHERGAFTDAKQSYQGLVGEAQNGTLFLDEIDTLTAKGQAALLRFLQEKTYRRVGGQGQHQANVRLIAACNADLEALVGQGRFRQDLWYRLNVLNLVMPPLRQRENDAVELAQTYVKRLQSQYQQPHRHLSPEGLCFIQDYHWPGNVRELHSLLLREFLLCDGDEMHCLESRQLLTTAATSSPDSDTFKEAKARAVARFERDYVARLLTQTGGNISQAARLAGQDRSAFGKLVRKYGLQARESTLSS